jgi:hypothetical protein
MVIMSNRTLPVFLIIAGFAFGCTDSIPTQNVPDQEIVFADDGAVLAKTPLYGEMVLDFVGGVPAGAPTWAGTVEIGGVTYGMAFFTVGTGKPFGADHPNQGTKLIFYEEIWEIYGEGEAWDDVDPTILLSGPDEGVVTVKNLKYRMNGSVEEAVEPFAMWVGRNVHMSGDIVWPAGGPPVSAPGIFRIN